jgi:hypothetical protein
MPMRGFDPEFRDLPDFIVKITERIWEGRGIGLIRQWYAADCLVHTSMGPASGAQATVTGTLDTLNTLPDRRLLPEDIIWSGDDIAGFLSSHRLICPGTHKGDGPLGPPTGRAVTVRAIADCRCLGNQVVEEWLVRDFAGLCVQVGVNPTIWPAGLRLRTSNEDASRGSSSPLPGCGRPGSSARPFIRTTRRPGSYATRWVRSGAPTCMP